MTRRSGLTRAAAEDILDGRSAHPGSLGSVLSAATAPASADELAGFDTAMAAYVTQPAGAQPTMTRKSMIASTIAKLLAAKVLLTTAAAAAVGGVALAAATGHLSPTTTHPAGTHSPAARSDASTNAPVGLHSTTPPVTPGRGNTSTHPSASPSPSLYGLCHAWVAGAGTSGHTAGNPAFTALATAAGGPSSIDSFCATLLAAPHPSDASSETPADPTHTHPTAAPGNPTHPTGPPSGHGNSTHPTGPPSTHRTGPPSTHPTGAPTS